MPPHPERSVRGYLPGAMLPISLLTDFGWTDTYVGQMKAALLQVAPTAVLVDLTHAVPAQDVRAGTFLLWSAVEAFPPGSLHLAVVDPGVGSTRRAVAARHGVGTCWWGNLVTNLPGALLPPPLPGTPRVHGHLRRAPRALPGRRFR
jgi:hypothetical protein